MLPGAAYTEKQGTYANMEGRAQETLAAITPPTLARVDWNIVRAVSEVANHTLPYDNLVKLRERMAQIAPNLLQLNRNLKPTTIKPPTTTSAAAKVSKGAGNAKLTPLLKELADYYQTDVISRASVTMAKCVQATRKEQVKRGGEAEKMQQKA